MNKSVLLSIHPEWCELIASGKKTIEVRKTRPKLETPFKCSVYCTAPKNFYTISEHMATSAEYLHLCDGKVTMSDGFEFFGREDYEVLNRKVIGEFMCDEIEDYSEWGLTYDALLRHIKLSACIDYPQIIKYLGGKSGYGWHISDFRLYDKPRKLSKFYRYCTEKDDCHKCIHWDSSYDNTYYEPPDPPFEGCMTGEKKHLNCPPQSWCYVEDGE